MSNTINPGWTKKKGEFLEAFKNGDIEKVLFLSNDVPEDAKSGILIVVEHWIKCKDMMSPLIAAIAHGSYCLVKLLVEDGALQSVHFEKRLHPLSSALRNKQTKIAEYLIHSGADVNKFEYNGTTPIFWAIKMKHPPYIIEQIISAGFLINTIAFLPLKWRAIHCAVSENYPQAVKLLLKYPAELNVITSEAATAINMAVKTNSLDIVELLVKHGASLKIRNSNMSPLFIAIRFKNLKMTETLLDLGASIEYGWVINEGRIPALQFAISYTLDIDIVKFLIARGANVNSRNDSDETALHAACEVTVEGEETAAKANQVKVAKLLIQKGADINAKDRKGNPPLVGAIYSQNRDLCQLLIKEGADVKGTECIEDFEMFLSCFEGMLRVNEIACPEIVKLFLDHGADYNYRNGYGLTAYHLALVKYSVDIIKIFWQQGCPYDQTKRMPGIMMSELWREPDAEKKRCLEVQAEFIEGINKCKLDLVKKSLKNGAEPKGCSTKISSTLHHVAENENHELARLLLEKGVSVNRVNDKGLTPLLIAVLKKNVQLCKVFLQFGACYKNLQKINGKTLQELVKEEPSIHELFKKIYKSFNLVKQGDTKVLKLLQQIIKSDDEDMLPVLMNCVNSKGLSLIGLALHLEHSKIAKALMTIRVEKM